MFLRTLFVVFAVLFSSSSSYSQDVAAQQKPIRLPLSKTPTMPSVITEIKTDQWFVIEADLPCIVLASRVGFVDVVAEQGPLRLRGKFCDGEDKVETRTYSSKHLWILEAKNIGEVELLIVPSTAKDESAVIRRTLVVTGIGPRPPPKPIPPDPSPLPPEPIKSSLLTAIVVEDALQRTPATAAIIADLGFWKSIEGQVDNLHVVPSIAPLAAQYKIQLTEAKGVLPLLILMDAKSKKVLYSGALPADKVAVAALVNKFTK